MRPKLVIGVLVAAVLLFAGISLFSYLVRYGARPPVDRAAAAPMEESVAGQPIASPLTQPNPAIGSRPLTNAVPAVSPEAAAAHEKFVRQRIAELDNLAMKDDDASREAIMSELGNPDKAIRDGALEAIVQFGDRSVVPRLQDLAGRTEDAGEKAAILEAADYLNLPSLSEYLAERRQVSLTNRATNMPTRDPLNRRQMKVSAPQSP